METTESKSQAYHRLVKEDRWDEASTFRLAQRDIFRKQGKSSDEAKALSWQAMIEKYPTPDDEMRQLLEFANSWPYDSRNLLLRRVWFAVHAPRALNRFAVDGEIPLDVINRASRACDHGFGGLLYAAICNPQAYLDMAKRDFEWEIDERRKPPSERDEEVATMMEQQLKELPELAALKPLSLPPHKWATGPDGKAILVETAAV